MTLGKLVYSLNETLQILDLDTGQGQALSDQVNLMHAPAWHPDGGFLAYAAGHVYVTKLGTNTVRPLSPPDAVASAPAWSPDGRRLIYDLQGAESGLYLHDLPSNAVIRIPLPFLAFQAAWHPDGQQIAFVGLVDGAKHIFSLDLACLEREDCAKAVRQLTKEGKFNHSPAWSPDGARIAFERFNERTEKWGIMIMDADGGNLRQVSDPAASDHHPTWGPGGAIAFEREGQGTPANIYMMMADGSRLTAITTKGGREPDWWIG